MIQRQRHAFSADHPLLVGVNFWSRSGGPRMWVEYDADLVGSELDQMRDHGMTVTRSFLFWPDAMPGEHQLDEDVIARYEDFLDAHARRGMSTIPTFIVGHMSGQNWDPSWRAGRDLLTDVRFVAAQSWFARRLAERFGAHPAVAAWLVSNEMPIYLDPVTRGVGSVEAADVAAWAELIVSALRAGGATQPVSLGDGAWGVEITGVDNGFRVRDLAETIDFVGPHVYRMEKDQVSQLLGAAYVCELLDFTGKPIVLEEFGATSSYASDENIAHYYRQSLHHTLLAGASGWLAWNNTDYDHLGDRDPYRHHPQEMHFGIVDTHGEPKPAAREMLRFASFLREADVELAGRPATDVAIVVPEILDRPTPFVHPRDLTAAVEATRHSYIAAREAGLDPVLVREGDGIPAGARLYLVPSTKQLTAPSWRRLRELAEAGAVVYASHFTGDHLTHRASWWPWVEETFGVRHHSRYGLVESLPPGPLAATFIDGLGDLVAGDELSFATGGNDEARNRLPLTSTSARVLAVDGEGAPLLTANPLGRGTAILCAAPVEFMAAQRREVNPEDTWRLYRALAVLADALPPVTSGDPRVLTGELHHPDGHALTWFINVSADEVTVRPTVRDGVLRTATPLHRGPGARASGSEHTLTLAPFEVTVLRRDAATGH